MAPLAAHHATAASARIILPADLQLQNAFLFGVLCGAHRARMSSSSAAIYLDAEKRKFTVNHRKFTVTVTVNYTPTHT
jgi:hypothetical protein